MLDDRERNSTDDIESLQSWSDCMGEAEDNARNRKSMSSLSLTSSGSEKSNQYPIPSQCDTYLASHTTDRPTHLNPVSFERSPEPKFLLDSVFGATVCDDCDSNVNRNITITNSDVCLKAKRPVAPKQESLTSHDGHNDNDHHGYTSCPVSRLKYKADIIKGVSVFSNDDSKNLYKHGSSSCICTINHNNINCHECKLKCTKSMDNSKSISKHTSKKHQPQSVLDKFCDREHFNSTFNVDNSIEISDDEQHNSLVQNVYPLLDDVANTNKKGSAGRDDIYMSNESILKVDEASSRLSSDVRSTLVQNSYVFKSGYPHSRHIGNQKVSGVYLRNPLQSYSPCLTSGTSSQRHTRDGISPQSIKQGYNASQSGQFRSQQNISVVHRDLKILPKSTDHLDALRNIEQHRLEPDNVKNKLKSAWNNLKYGMIYMVLFRHNAIPYMYCE